MAGKDIYSYYREELMRLRGSGSLRSLKTTRERDGKYISCQGKRLINLSSNDYLGLATDREMVKNFYMLMDERNLLDSFGPGSTSSRLLTGNYPLYQELEDLIQGTFRSAALQEQGGESGFDKGALIFNSGYHANTGIFQAMAGEGDLILSDSLNHASIIDGIRLSRAERETIPHLDYGYLEEVLERKRERYRNVIIATESIFSMDGDTADLKRLVGIKNRYGAMLYVDEAHALGIYGENGLGMSEIQGTLGDTDIIVATFGKALGAHGAFALVPGVIREFLINRMRTLIFSTALPPATLAWNLFIFNKINTLRERRLHLLETSEKLRRSLGDAGFSIPGSGHIIPVILGENFMALRASEMLMDQGFLIFPIRPPTVPRGTSRIRISLTSLVDWGDVENIPRILKGVNSGSGRII